MIGYPWELPRYGRLLVGNVSVDMGIAVAQPPTNTESRSPQLGWFIAGLLAVASALLWSLPSNKNSLPFKPTMEIMLNGSQSRLEKNSVVPMASARAELPRRVMPKPTRQAISEPITESPPQAAPAAVAPVTPVPAMSVAESAQNPGVDAIVVNAPVGNGVVYGSGSGKGNSVATPATGNGLGRGNGSIGDAGMVELDREPRLLGGLAPAYPENALDEGIEAVVVASVEISAAGKVQKIVIVKSGGRDFDKAVMAAARQASYAAPVIQGVARPAKFIRTYRFELE